MSKTLTAEQIVNLRRYLNFGYGVMTDDERKDADAILTFLATQQPEPRDEVTDTERLDWLIAQQAWIQWTMRDGSILQCQVYDQDEDENYHILSGDDRYFNTPREAIDAAMSAGDSHE